MKMMPTVGKSMRTNCHANVSDVDLHCSQATVSAKQQCTQPILGPYAVCITDSVYRTVKALAEPLGKRSLITSNYI